MEVAKHGEVALEKLRERSHDVIVTDIRSTIRSRDQDILPTWHHICSGGLLNTWRASVRRLMTLPRLVHVSRTSRANECTDIGMKWNPVVS